MKLHKRTTIFEAARNELAMFMIDLEKKYKLTYGEMFSMLSLRIADLAKSLIRAERHPDEPGKGGDEA